MKISIQYKLFAAMLLATLSVVGIMALIIQWSVNRSFLEYVNVVEKNELNSMISQLEEYYAETGSWSQLLDDPRILLRLHADTIQDDHLRNRRLDTSTKRKPARLEGQGRGGDDHHSPLQRFILLDQEGGLLFGHQEPSGLPHLEPIMHGGEQVASIGLYPFKKLSRKNELLFAQKQKLALFISCVMAMLITVVISMALAYHLTKPIRTLSGAARKLITGDYAVRVSIRSKDELEGLSADFNSLAETLEENQEQRKRWVSDIAHELRTPLTTLKGEIEALQDGIRQPDQRTYTNLYQGVQRLERLVEDLCDLNRSDLGVLTMRNEAVDLVALVEQEASARKQELAAAGLSLIVESGVRPALLLGDLQRLQQLIGNLLTNSIRYTDSGGRVVVTIGQEADGLIVDVEDSRPGVPDVSLPRLFNRLYRVEQSRNRALGGAGLGLAICRQIVLAHGGTITARHSSLGGLHIRLQFLPYKEIGA